MDTFSEQPPANLVNTLHKMLKTYRVEFLERKDITLEAIAKGITDDMRKELEAAVMKTGKKSLPTEVKTRWRLDQKQVSVAALIVLILGRDMDKSDERQEELRRVADKI